MVAYDATINASGISQVTVVNNTTPEVVNKTVFPATYTFTSGDNLTFIATPTAGYSFNNWTIGSTIATANPYTTAALTAAYAITGAATAGYSSQTQVVDWAQITSTDLGTVGDSYADSIAYFVRCADRAIDHELNVPEGFFRPNGLTITELHDGAGLTYQATWMDSPYQYYGTYPLLRLNVHPILSLTTVESLNSSGAWDTLTVNVDYVLDPIGVRFLSNIPRYSYQNIRVTYIAGYTTTPIQVSSVSAQLAASIIQRVRMSKNRNTSGSEGFNAGGIGISRSSASGADAQNLANTCFTNELKMELAKYRNVTPPRMV